MNPYSMLAGNASATADRGELSLDAMISSAAYRLVLMVERLIEAATKR